MNTPTTLRLHHSIFSASSQKVRLALVEKGLAHESVAVDLQAGEQHTPAYRALNPRGVVPTLIHGGAVLMVSHADLVALPYVARLEQMGLLAVIDDAGRASLAGWYDRMKARPSWRETIGALPPQVIQHWQTLGRQAWPAIAPHLRRRPPTF